MTLTGRQVELFGAALHQGAGEASHALARWIDRPTRISFDSFEQLTLDAATSVLGSSDEPICFCSAELTGRLAGHLILAFDDASGLALADMLLGKSRGTSTEWGEMEMSAALETTNIVCCAYMNALIRVHPGDLGDQDELVPSPPRFARDFAASLMQFALMDQIITSDQVLLARTEFRIEKTPVDWTLLFVPDAESMTTLSLDAS
jgi:chemotaxis protein CheC